MKYMKQKKLNADDFKLHKYHDHMYYIKNKNLLEQ